MITSVRRPLSLPLTSVKPNDSQVGADIDQRHPNVTSDVFDWGTWILSILGDSTAGFRFDAIKHIDEDFVVAFIKHEKTGQPNLFAVGEFWSDSIGDIFRYLDGFGAQVRSVRQRCPIY